MKRWMRRIPLCLILGAVTTVAVAWGLAWLNELNRRHVLSNVQADQVFDCFAEDDIRAFGGTQFDSIGVRRRDVIGAVYAEKGSRIDHFLRLVESGFPCLALYGWTHQDDLSGGLALARPRWGVHSSTTKAEFLPLRPIWPGFLTDTIFYGANWFGFFLGVSATRRIIRRRRGRCPKCAYDLHGDLDRGCPECGWNREGSPENRPSPPDDQERVL